MGNDGRYIRALHVKASDESVLSRSVTALEDAFNTASLPGLPRNGMVFIRNFDLGCFSGTITSTTLSLLIDQKIREVSGMAVCVDDGENPDAPVVWFTDDVQPYISMAGLLAEGREPSAWYWRSAIPPWQPAMRREQAILTLITGAMGTSAKMFAPARLLHHLLETKCLDVLLNALTPEAALEFLSGAGIDLSSMKGNRGARTGDSSPSQYMNAAWQRVLVRWIEVWGEQDARSLWLTYNAILHHNPAVAESHSALDMVQQFITTLIKEYSYHTIKAEQSADAVVNRERLEEREVPELSEGTQETGVKKALLSDSGGSRLSASDDLYEQTGQARPVSQFAGLVFIIPLMEAAGIRDILNQNAEFVDCNFPGRLLWAVARRCKIPVNDPVYESLPDLAEREDNRVSRFVAPESWENIVLSPVEKHRSLYRFQIAEDSQKWVLTDRTKKIILAFGPASQRNMLPRWLSDCDIKTSTDIRIPPDINSMENIMQLILGLYLRRFAGMSLKTLVRRKGNVETTKTHIDALFDVQDADVRIRKAGLDINPGWVSWLGKVVNYHYGSEEERGRV